VNLTTIRLRSELPYPDTRSLGECHATRCRPRRGLPNRRVRETGAETPARTPVNWRSTATTPSRPVHPGVISMGMTLAELDRWDPDAAHSVFDAAISRAQGTRTGAAGIGDVMATVPGTGRARDAAAAAAGRISTDLLPPCRPVPHGGRAAAAAESDIRAVKADWQGIQRTADSWASPSTSTPTRSPTHRRRMPHGPPRRAAVATCCISASSTC
jgi:hypothetical protein